MRCHAQLSSTFYEKTCPNVLSTIRTSIRQAVASERRMAASLIRLHFHDCFVQVGGPSWTVMLGRRDSTTANSTQANSDLLSKSCWSKWLVTEDTTLTTRVRILAPAKQIYLQRRVSDYKKKNSDLPFFKSSLDELISNFEKKGLNARDMVVLSGAHTIGQAQCFTFHDRIYNNGRNNDAAFASRRKQNCPTRGRNSEVAPLDFVTPHKFDNNYFKNLMQKKGLLHSDQVLFNGGSTDDIVSAYSKNPLVFKSEFATAMIKMGNIEPLTGTEGVIRKICSTLN